jgi:hypothetical protein
MHGARTLKPLYVGDHVRVKTYKEKYWEEAGIITSADYANRTYSAETQSGNIRRNRRHLLHINDEMPNSLVPASNQLHFASDFHYSSVIEPEAENRNTSNSDELLST